MRYDHALDPDMYWNIMRVKMWEHGHSFSDIDNMSIEEIGYVLGYWSEKNQIEKSESKARKRRGK